MIDWVYVQFFYVGCMGNAEIFFLSTSCNMKTFSDFVEKFPLPRWPGEYWDYWSQELWHHSPSHSGVRFVPAFQHIQSSNFYIP